MKVLFLVPTRGWPQRITPFTFLDEEIRGLADAGIEIYLLSTEVRRDERQGAIHMLSVPHGTWRDRLQTLPFLLKTIPHLPKGSLRDMRRTFHGVRLERYAAEAVRRHSIDVMHVHFAPYGFTGVLARAATGTPLVATFRGMDLLVDPSIEYGARQDPIYDRAVRILLRKADTTTYASEFMRETGIRLGASPDTAWTIRKGVDLQRFHVAENRPELRAELGFRGPTILTVAGLIPRKGIDTIIEALARLPPGLEAGLVICGEGYQKDQLVRLSEKLGVADRVSFRGWVGRDEVPGYFAACDVFVLASRLEAAGNVLLEAMASGRPVITTDSGGPPEYVQNGRTGYVVQPGDTTALAERLERLLTDPSLMETFGNEGRRAVEEAHRYDVMIEDFVQVYIRTIGRAFPGR